MILSWDHCSGEKSLKKDGETQLCCPSFEGWFKAPAGLRTAPLPLEGALPSLRLSVSHSTHTPFLQQRSDPLPHTLEKVSRVTLLPSINVLLGFLLNSHSALFWRNFRRKGAQKQADLKREHFTQARRPSPENSPLCHCDEPRLLGVLVAN